MMKSKIDPMIWPKMLPSTTEMLPYPTVRRSIASDAESSDFWSIRSSAPLSPRPGESRSSVSSLTTLPKANVSTETSRMAVTGSSIFRPSRSVKVHHVAQIELLCEVDDSDAHRRGR